MVLTLTILPSYTTYRYNQLQLKLYVAVIYLMYYLFAVLLCLLLAIIFEYLWKGYIQIKKCIIQKLTPITASSRAFVILTVQ